MDEFLYDQTCRYCIGDCESTSLSPGTSSIFFHKVEIYIPKSWASLSIFYDEEDYEAYEYVYNIYIEVSDKKLKDFFEKARNPDGSIKILSYLHVNQDLVEGNEIKEDEKKFYYKTVEEYNQLLPEEQEYFRPQFEWKYTAPLPIPGKYSFHVHPSFYRIRLINESSLSLFDTFAYLWADLFKKGIFIRNLKHGKCHFHETKLCVFPLDKWPYDYAFFMNITTLEVTFLLPGPFGEFCLDHIKVLHDFNTRFRTTAYMQKPKSKNYKPPRQQKVYNVTAKEKDRKYNKQDDLYKIEITFKSGVEKYNLKTLGHWRDHPQDVEHVEGFLKIAKVDVQRDIKKMLFPGNKQDNEIITTFQEVCNKIVRSLPDMPKGRTPNNITASFLTAAALDRFVAEFNKQYKQAERLPGDNPAMDKLIKHHQELKNMIDGIMILDK